MEILSLFRQAQHQEFRQLVLSGAILDLGGSKKSEYATLIKGTHAITVVNLDPKTMPDIVHDLEQPLPTGDETYEAVLMINVLEHIYNFRELINESYRVLKPNGQVVVTVPFLFPIHASPRDFWRFTKETLEREFRRAGFREVLVKPIGTGLFRARFQMIDRHLPAVVRIALYPFRYLAVAFDFLFVGLARILGKQYQPNDYALGYFIIAKK